MSGDPKLAIYKYLRDQNRPYSINDILLNLHKEHGKTALQKAIDVLVVEGKVIEKVWLREGFSNFATLKNDF